MSNAKTKTSPGLIVLLVKLASKFFAKAWPIVGKIFAKAGGTKAALAAASMAAYSVVFTWKFALLILIAIGIHESGHVWAMRKLGIKTKGFYFLPFVGGAAIAEEEFPSREAEVFVALMGPIWGLGTALVPLVLYAFTSDPLWAAAAGWIAMINVFNLLPINPLDGGRVVKSISFSFGERAGVYTAIAGIGLGVVVAFGLEIVLVGMMCVIGALELLGERYRMRKFERNWADYQRGLKLVEEKEQVLKLALISGPKCGRTYEEMLKTLPPQWHRDYHIVRSSVISYEAGDIQKERKYFEGMNRKAVWTSVAFYAILSGILLTIVFGLAHIPGASIAAQFLAE